MSNYVRRLIFGVSIAGVLMLFFAVSPTNAVQSLQFSATPKAFLRLGVAAFQNGDYPVALEHFTQAIQFDADYGSAYSNRCLTYLELKGYQNAISDCTQALQLNSSNLEAYLNRGLAYYRLDEYENSIADYTELLKLKPDDYRAYYNRGLAQIGLAQVGLAQIDLSENLSEIDQDAYQTAIIDFDQALHQVSPSDRTIKSEIYSDRGLAQLMLNHSQQAIEDFTQSIQFDRVNINTFYNRGCAYHQQGDLVAAIDDFTQVLQQVPDHAQAYLSRGMIRHELGEQSGALTDLQSAAQYFHQQGLIQPYQQTLSLIEKIRSLGLAIG